MDTNRISISSLGLPKKADSIYLQVGEVTIELLPSPSYKELIEVTQWAVNLIIDNRPFISHPMKTIFMDMAIVKAFTNIDVSIPANATENDVYMIYEAVKGANLPEEIKLKADGDKYKFLTEGINQTLDSILTYRNSARGVINILAAEAEDNSQTFAKALQMYSDEGNLQEVAKLMKMVETLNQPQA